MRVGSLFAGVGGFDIAAERAGFEVAFQIENDKRCQEVLEGHWPAVPRFGDIKEVDADGLPEVDILAGGFPCQDYSRAGKRAGLAGDRGALWWDFARLIDGLRPRWVVGENVPGLISSRGGADFETIIRSLTERGYGVVWAVLDAQYFGVAQRRRRVFIVGHSGGEPRPGALDLAYGSSGDPAPSREAGKVANAITASSLGGGGVDDNNAQGGHLIVEDPVAPITRSNQGGNALSEESVVGGHLLAVGNQRLEYRDAGDLVPALVRQSGTQEPLLVNVQPGSGGKEYTAREVELSPTLAAVHENGRGVRVVEDMSVRRLTPLECERLQGFPDNWTASMAKTVRYRQMGNAVAVPVVEWIMRQIAKEEK